MGEYWNTLGVNRYRNGDDKGAIADLETSMKLRAGGDSFDWSLPGFGLSAPWGPRQGS